MSEIIIYTSADNQIEVNVQSDGDTVWLSQVDFVHLFERDQSVISRHINNVFKEGELDKKSNMQKMHIPNSDKPVAFYNLEVIISVGYRVKSLRGTQFRIWANKVLKSYLTKGYAVNEQALRASETKLKSLQHSIELLKNVIQQKQLSSDEAVGLLKVVTEYSRALDLLDQYDHQSLSISDEQDVDVNQLAYKEAIRQVIVWRDNQNAGSLFGNEKDQSFKSSLDTIYQTFDGVDLYPSVEEKAANLLYFVVKNHSFTDGNKRIAAGLFILFLDMNNRLYNFDNSKIIADNALVAITIMIAESKTDEKEIMIKLIVNLMSKH